MLNVFLWLTCDNHSQCKARVRGPAKCSEFKKLFSEVLQGERGGWFLPFWAHHPGYLETLAPNHPRASSCRAGGIMDLRQQSHLCCPCQSLGLMLFSADLSTLLWGVLQLLFHSCTPGAGIGRASPSEVWMTALPDKLRWVMRKYPLVCLGLSGFSFSS